MFNEKPSQKFNLVVYYEDNKRLQKKKKKPLFYEGVYIYNGEGGHLYAYDAKKFDANVDSTDDEDDDIDPTIEIIDKVTDVSFKYCGIWIHGLEHARGDDKRATGETYWYQTWLITNLTREELEKEDWIY